MTTAQSTGLSDAGRVDLHAHTTASDGRDTPSALVHLALERNIVALGITDHDSMTGIPEAIRAAKGTALAIFPGVEFNTDVPGREVHVIGYFADPNVPAVREYLHMLRDNRENRARRIVEKLWHVGVDLPWELVAAQATGAIGRPHVARALVAAGYVESVQEAFDRYLAKGQPAYEDHYRITPEGAVELIIDGGGVPVLAHPIDVLDYVEPLVNVGLQGLEVYYPTHTPEDTQTLLDLVDLYGLIATGGTDHHGYPKVEDVTLGDLDIPLESARQLRAACNAARKRHRYQHEHNTPQD